MMCNTERVSMIIKKQSDFNAAKAFYGIDRFVFASASLLTDFHNPANRIYLTTPCPT